MSNFRSKIILPDGVRTSARMFLALLLIVGLSWTVPSMVMAEEPPEDLTEMSLEDLMNLQVKTVASASRYKQDISDAPASVTIITGEQIRRYGYRTLADVLRSVIGFNVTYDRNYNYLGVRGVGLPGDYNARILLMVDGHRFNEPSNDSFFTGPGLGIDINDVKKIEIVRGPASALYGQNAMLAIVNVITKAPADGSGEEVQVTLGEPGITTLAARTRGSTSGGVDYSVGVLGHHREGHHILEYPEFADPDIVDYDDPEDGNADYTGFTVDSDGEDALSIRSRVNVGKLAVTAFVVDWKKVIPTGSFGVNFDTGEEVSEEGYYYLDLNYTSDKSGDFSWSIKGTTEHYYYKGQYPYAYAYNYSVPTWRDAPYTIFKDDWTADWQNLEFHGDYSGISSNRLNFGARYTLNNVDLEGFDVDPFAVYVDEELKFHSISAFVQDEITLADNTSLILGLNHNIYDEDLYRGDVERTNPRLGIIVGVGSRTRLKGLYGEAFRVPNLNEMVYDDGDTQISNLNLKPEVVRTGEIILEHDFGSSWGLRTSVYRTSLESLIQAEDVPGPGGTVIQFLNSPDDIISTGAELEVRKYISEDISGYLSIAVQTTENDNTGEKLPNSPEEMVNLGVSLPLVRGEVYLSVDNQYVGEVLSADLTEKIDPYFWTNATLSHKAVASGLEMSFSVYNLFDVNYSHPGTFDHVQTEIPQDGRTLGANLKYSF